jgi:uncharacterized protein (UPF0548 family)
VTRGELTYPEVGATAGDLPAGYRHLRRSASLGSGLGVFRTASAELLGWEMHRRAGLTVLAEAPTARLGSDVRLGNPLGPIRIWASCRVVRLVDEPTFRGFAYGTLQGHPECGEESFLVRIAAHGAVTIDIVSFSRPACWWSRAGAPAMRVGQQRITRRYLAALRGHPEAAGPTPDAAAVAPSDSTP